MRLCLHICVLYETVYTYYGCNVCPVIYTRFVVSAPRVQTYVDLATCIHIQIYAHIYMYIYAK